ncbi:MAG: integrase, partial [Nitrosopumilus sp.]|nr:integrase [Nitrosopumilus sp.]
MKITKEEFQRSEEESPLDLYYQGIRSKETKEKYTRTLRYVLCNTLEDILEGSFEERAEQLVNFAREDPGWAKDILLNISKKLRERTQLSPDHPNYFKPSSMNNYFKPLKKLFDMNDIALPWKRIYSTFPELENLSNTRGWTKQEIQQMLKFSKGAIDRAVVLVASSSGIRSGGFSFQWGDIQPVYQIDDELRFEITESQVQSSEIV